MAYSPILNPHPVTVGSALPAGAALLGKVGIDQATPGQTNAVVERQLQETMALILIEMKTINTMLQIGLSVRDDPADIRENFARGLN